MGNPLYLLFADFYMDYIEEQIFANNNNKLPIYARYVVYIFAGYNNLDDLYKWKKYIWRKFLVKKNHTHNKLFSFKYLTTVYTPNFTNNILINGNIQNP